ncbi:unnamed protein product, partial [Mesorhabditis belari]|uniref:Uncharacterized protein n=1 Tax=Mesorhabditis belari TaxID=2138241 RepID=A0AAF3EFR2_9BILA
MVEPSYISEEVVIKDEEIGDENGYDDRESTHSSTSFDEDQCRASPTNQFLYLCESIDPMMDESFQRDSWILYDRVNAQCCLESSEIPWMAASLFAHQQMQKKIVNMPRFRYPLCKILEAGKLSAIEFFDRLSRISDIFNQATSSRLLNQCRRIQNTLAISAVIYKKYLPIFRYVFSRPTPDMDLPAAPQQIFRLIWYLFINVKRQLSAAANEDLLVCFHVLLCCVDLVVRDLDAHEHQSTLTQEFLNETKGGGELLLSTLCNRFEGAALDAKHFKMHWFEKTILEKIPFNEPPDFAQNAEHYINDLEAVYGEQLHLRGEFDERLFVPLNFSLVYNSTFDAVSIEMLRRSEQSEWSVDTSLILRMSTQACLEKVDKFKATPLSGKAYIMSSEQFCPMTPAQAPTLSTERLEALIPDGWTIENSELYRCFSDYHDDPLQEIMQAIETLSERFLAKIEEEQTALGANFDQQVNGSIEKIKTLSANLFYRFLEKIIIFERSRMSVYRDVDFTAIVRKDEFLASLYALVLELVMASKKSIRSFPWVLDMIGLPAVNFYKIIEVVIRSESALSREMVKHLNRLEERILEEYAWSFDSPLWSLLSRRADVVPSCKQVWTSEMSGDLYSPAKRMRVDEDEMPSSGVLTLFFRKIYYLASVRLVDLCERLKMNETAKSRVWTLVEYMLRTETSLMAGRHLDQNLMCCLYVAARSLNLEITFNQIMQQYKQQPQASSEVYRAVVVEIDRPNDGTNQTLDPDGNSLGDRPPSQHTVAQHENVDIITYYNRVFIQRVENFVKRLESTDFASLHLQLPALRPFALTPNKRIISERISVQALSPPSMTAKNASYRLNAVGGGPVRTIQRTSDLKPTTTLRRVVTTGNSLTSSTSSTSSSYPITHPHQRSKYFTTTAPSATNYKRRSIRFSPDLRENRGRDRRESISEGGGENRRFETPTIIIFRSPFIFSVDYFSSISPTPTHSGTCVGMQVSAVRAATSAKVGNKAQVIEK